MHLCLDKPERPVGQPVVSHITAQSLSLAWSGPSYDGGSQVTHYRVEVKATDSEQWKTVTSECQVRGDFSLSVNELLKYKGFS